MRTVFSFSHKDAELALKTATWIAELGGVSRHDCIMLYNEQAADKTEPILAQLTKAFRTVDTLSVRDTVDQKWPQAPNNMFIRVNKDKILNVPEPFMWLEPDAIPLEKDWLNKIEDEFTFVHQTHKKCFMGDRVIVEQVPEHMSGVAVYFQIDFNASNYVTANNIAWDVVAASQILPKCHFTKLIQHEWKPEPFKTMEDLKRIRQGAVIYHQNKGGELIDLLRNGLVPSLPITTNTFQIPIETLHKRMDERMGNSVPKTIIEQIRGHCDALKAIEKEKSSRGILIIDELRKRKLIPQARKRK